MTSALHSVPKGAGRATALAARQLLSDARLWLTFTLLSGTRPELSNRTDKWAVIFQKQQNGGNTTHNHCRKQAKRCGGNRKKEDLAQEKRKKHEGNSRRKHEVVLSFKLLDINTRRKISFYGHEDRTAPRSEKSNFDILARTCNLRVQEAEARGLPQIWGQSGLFNKRLSQSYPARELASGYKVTHSVYL